MKYRALGLEFTYHKNVYSPEYSSLGCVEIATKLIKDGRPNLSVLDVGCGCGFLGLCIKKKNPLAVVSLSDVSEAAVKCARANSKRLGLEVVVMEQDLLGKLGCYDIIVANLPTYSDEDMKQPLNGPREAYYAGEPLSLYSRLFKEAKGRCHALVCECQAKYQAELLELAKSLNYVLIMSSESSFGFLAPR